MFASFASAIGTCILVVFGVSIALSVLDFCIGMVYGIIRWLLK